MSSILKNNRLKNSYNKAYKALLYVAIFKQPHLIALSNGGNRYTTQILSKNSKRHCETVAFKMLLIICNWFNEKSENLCLFFFKHLFSIEIILFFLLNVWLIIGCFSPNRQQYLMKTYNSSISDRAIHQVFRRGTQKYLLRDHLYKTKYNIILIIYFMIWAVHLDI